MRQPRRARRRRRHARPVRAPLIPRARPPASPAIRHVHSRVHALAPPVGPGTCGQPRRARRRRRHARPVRAPLIPRARPPASAAIRHVHARVHALAPPVGPGTCGQPRRARRRRRHARPVRAPLIPRARPPASPAIRHVHTRVHALAPPVGPGTCGQPRRARRRRRHARPVRAPLIPRARPPASPAIRHVHTRVHALAPPVGDGAHAQPAGASGPSRTDPLLAALHVRASPAAAATVRAIPADVRASEAAVPQGAGLLTDRALGKQVGGGVVARAHFNENQRCRGSAAVRNGHPDDFAHGQRPRAVSDGTGSGEGGGRNFDRTAGDVRHMDSALGTQNAALYPLPRIRRLDLHQQCAGRGSTGLTSRLTSPVGVGGGSGAGPGVSPAGC